MRRGGGVVAVLVLHLEHQDVAALIQLQGGQDGQKAAVIFLHAGHKTAVYISHRLASCRFCDVIAVFDQGQIVQQGTHEELVKDEKGKYHQLWYAQAQYYSG